MEQSWRKIIISIVLIIVLFMSGYWCYTIDKSLKEYTEQPIETIYNKVYKDTIIYDVEYRDTIIFNLKEEMKYEIEKAIDANDSSVVEQFKSLAGAN